MTPLQFKASQDTLFQYHAHQPDAWLRKAGFIDDSLPQPVRRMTAFRHPLAVRSFDHVQRTQHQGSYGQRHVVLLTTGSFSPLHQGHIAMMKAAREEAHRRGWHVLGGFMSASSDHYVHYKQQGQAAWPAAYRMAWAQAMLQDHSWLRPCFWESMIAPSNLNFSDVIEHLQSDLAQQGFSHVDVVYVFGQDNADFSQAFAHDDFLCMPRTNPSSTAVRQGDLHHLPAALHSLYQALRHHADTTQPPVDHPFIGFPLYPSFPSIDSSVLNTLLETSSLNWLATAHTPLNPLALFQDSAFQSTGWPLGLYTTILSQALAHRGERLYTSSSEGALSSLHQHRWLETVHREYRTPTPPLSLSFQP